MIKYYRQSGAQNNWLVTVAIGEKYLRNFEQFALPSWKKYCERYDLGILAIDEHLISSEDPAWKKPNWQKLLMPELLLSQVPNVKHICYLDTDILINPFAPNIFEHYDGKSYGLTSRINNLPMPLDLVQRQFVFLRHTYYDENYPLDSVVFMPLEKQYEFSNLHPWQEASCTGLILCNPKLMASEMAGWFYKYNSTDDSVTGGEQTHVNHEILSTQNVQWLQYEFQATWVYEMAWKYPFLYGKHQANKKLIIDCIEASLFSNYFLHFGGSWHESSMWLLEGIMESDEFESLNEGFSNYKSENLVGEPKGHIKPKENSV